MSQLDEAQGQNQKVTVQVHVYHLGTCSAVLVETTLPLAAYKVKQIAKEIFMAKRGMRNVPREISAQVPADERERLDVLHRESLAVA